MKNSHPIWFKRKWYGWGWYPATWQGVLITIGYIALIVLCALTITDTTPVREIAFTFILPVILLTITFIRIAYARGESPRWQWGKPHDDHNGPKYNDSK